MDSQLFQNEMTHNAFSYPTSYMKHPFYESLGSRRHSFRKNELDGRTGFLDDCLGLAEQGFYKDVNKPNTYYCFCCGLELAVRKASFLEEVCLCNVHKMYNTTVSCCCAYWEIFKIFKTTDVKITEKINHASAHGLLGYEGCNPIAVWFNCHNELLVTGDKSLWDTILNNQSRGDDVDVNAELNTQENSHGTGFRIRLGVLNPEQNSTAESSLDETDGVRPSSDAVGRIARSARLDASRLLLCPFCTRYLSFDRVG
ncbi:unnamed protein product [Lymnaea stagnalis]|uniref:Uncharacterized protein n=1 Tax=Lymnaea stagnalis TaxID=6523 RepID=A0AAV2H3B5_LYMST